MVVPGDREWSFRRRQAVPPCLDSHWQGSQAGGLRWALGRPELSHQVRGPTGTPGRRRAKETEGISRVPGPGGEEGKEGKELTQKAHAPPSSFSWQTS